jgi:hypothetical protein
MFALGNRCLFREVGRVYLGDTAHGCDPQSSFE